MVMISVLELKIYYARLPYLIFQMTFFMNWNKNIELNNFHVYCKFLNRRHYFSVLFDPLVELGADVCFQQNQIFKVSF